jgi:nanoRNase/pAp phosphatase (c-di-AMP/oligoRNAs hydrolase)
MPDEKSIELESVLSSLKDKKILVSLRGCPDPDCISSALAHQRIARSMNVHCDIAYVEEISHQENRALMKLLDLGFTRYDGTNINPDNIDGYSLVDSQLPDNEMIELLKDKPVISIVDHHDIQGNLTAQFTDINKESGAAATLYGGYLESMNLLDEKNESDFRLATALMHGIRSDTDDLLNAHKRDYEISAFLTRFADLELLKKISMQSLTPHTMDTMMRAYQNKVISDNYLISGVGVLQKSERDAIPQSADFLLQRTGVDTVLTYGIIDAQVDCSFRTTNDGIRPADFISDAFPEVEPGKYGGRFDKGGFQLTLGPILRNLNTPKTNDLLEKVVDTYMQMRFYEKLGVKIEVESIKNES